MKMLLTSLALWLPVFIPVSQAAPELTTGELAQHLGVHHWRIKAADLPEDYGLRINEIRDGKILQTAMVFALPKGKKDDLVIITSLQGGHRVVTFRTETGTKGTAGGLIRFDEKIGSMSLGTAGKPRLNEPMVLLGDYRLQDGEVVLSGKVEDVTSGIAVTIVVQ